MINVTRTYLPPIDEFKEYLDKIWNSGWVTNQGPFVSELENRLIDFLGVNNLHLVSNGTIAIQFAIKALELEGEIITTPYSYVATTTSIIWENCNPVFCDIESNSFNLDPDNIENLITENTSAILATHVYGLPCDVDKIKSIADKHNLKVIYDGAHCFGVKLNGESIFNHGDISTVSFHATKLFHTIEGGAVITDDKNLSDKVYLFRAFGHLDDDYLSIGINGRTSELNAAMGLCNLKHVNDFINERKSVNMHYRELLKECPLVFPDIPDEVEYNYSYFPVLFENENAMLKAKHTLEKNHICPRRYFFPSLNELPYIKGNSCPVSENKSRRVLCLPVYNMIQEDVIKKISGIISACL